MVGALLVANLTIPAMEAVFASDVSRRAWLGSFVSVEMSFGGLVGLGWMDMSPLQRAVLGQKAENKYIGGNCGILDQFTSACGVSSKRCAPDKRWFWQLHGESSEKIRRRGI